jgi:amino acid adenylation domain-containing protein
MLCGIWSEVLGSARVGIDDNYFALGGDSIRSINIVARARAAGVAVNIRDVFKYQTIAELAGHSGADSSATPGLQPLAPLQLLSLQERQQLAGDPSVEDAYPLSLLQEGMYFHTELNSTSAVYHDVFSYCLEIGFERGPFERAVHALLQRHAVLRTSFITSCDNRLLQVVHKDAGSALQIEDISDLDPARQAEFLESLIGQERLHGFTWSRAPLLRIFVHLRGARRFQYTLSFHHAILDGWSVASLQSELLRHYRGLLNHETIDLQPPRSRYCDFIASEREALQSTAMREFWSGLLAEPTLLTLPVMSARAGRIPGNDCAVCTAPVDGGLARGLQALSRNLGVHVKALLLAAHVKVMSLLSGQDDILTGLLSNGRLEEVDAERTAGLFLNTLPLRLRLTDNTWRGLIAQVQELEQSMLPCRRFPLAAIQQLTGCRELVNTQFNYVQFHVYDRFPAAGAAEVSSAQGFEQTNFALTVNFLQEPGDAGLLLSINYDTALFSTGQVQRMAGYYLRALRMLADEVDARHMRAVLVPQEERQHLLDPGAATAADPATQLFFQEIFASQVRRVPHAMAVCFESDHLSYELLNRRANQLAHHLRDQGIGPESLVGLCMRPCLDMVVAWLAVLKAGAAYVPLDPNYPTRRLRSILAVTTPRTVVTHECCRSALSEVEQPVLVLDRDWGRIGSRPTHDLDPRMLGLTPRNLAYVIHTSGSTGEPKGVMVEHAALSNYLLWALRTYDVADGDCIVSTPLTFDATITSLYTALMCGRAITLLAQGEELEGLEERMRHPVGRSLAKLSPAHLAALAPRWERSAGGCSIGVFVIGGEALPPATVQRWRAIAPAARLVNEYGPTETVVGCSVYEIPDSWVATDAVPIGKPIANTWIHVLDRRWQPVPIGVTGEIHVGGAGVARGYLNAPGRTAERFLPDPSGAAEGVRVYKTGDLGCWQPDGNLDYRGRNDTQVKLRGYRVELQAIEAQLMQHECVDAAAVLVRDLAPEDQRMVAYVQCRGADATSGDDLRAHLRASQPDFMVPQAFVVLSELPLTANGKVDRKALLGLNPTHESRPPHAEPRGDVEQTLAAIWRELLKLESVGREDDFFALGGHSLLLNQARARIHSAFGLDVAMKDLFAAQTLREWAEHVEVLAWINASGRE